ncbi:MAG: hypothetical protein HY850_05060 [Betaproteobacteria bacterium]|nr:hypothetical protein [Betaproteobacteria bacterium]
MRTVGASGHGLPINNENGFLQQSATGLLPLLLDGLNRLRPELGPLADELIGLLSGDAMPADNSMPGTQD